MVKSHWALGQGEALNILDATLLLGKQMGSGIREESSL